MLGQAFLREATSRVHQVVATTRSGSGIHCDVTKDSELEQLLESCRPDLVVNCAAVVSFADCVNDPWDAWKVNARAVGVLAECCHNLDARLIHISTDHYFSGDGSQRHDETAPVRLLNEYARTKFAGEAFALTAADALVLRTNVIGFRGHGSSTFAEWAIELIENDREATLFEDSFVSSIDAATLAAVALDLSAGEERGILNVASSEVFSKKQMIEELARQMGRVLTNTTNGSVRDLPVPRAESCGLDVSRAEKALGRQLPDLQQVISNLLHQRTNVS